MIPRNQEDVNKTSTTRLLKNSTFCKSCLKISKNSIVGADKESTVCWGSVRAHLSENRKKVRYANKTTEYFSSMKSVIVKIIISKQCLAQKAASFLAFPFINRTYFLHSIIFVEFVSQLINQFVNEDTADIIH